jgi:uncharacterized protein YdaU (DUF1376 family)
MPLYVADYLADTAHLSAAQSGAYLHLIMHYWQTGGLPNDDRVLARIAKMSATEWRGARSIVQALFQDGWKHGRIDFELSEADRISKAGRAGGKASAAARRQQKQSSKRTIVERSLNDRGNDSSTIGQAPPPPPPSKSSDPYGSAANAAPDTVEVIDEDPKARLFRIGKTLLASFGVAEKRTGALIGQWLKTRNDPSGLLAAIQYARDQNVAEPVAYISTLVTKAPPNGTRKQNLADLASDLADELRERERAAGLVRPPSAQ